MGCERAVTDREFEEYKREIEERKQALIMSTSMFDVLTRYGVKFKGNRCRGFCHGGKDMNMKVFRDGCKCFVCSKNMDIFDVTMHFEDCDFFTAFKILGGEVEPDEQTRRKARQAILSHERELLRQTQIRAELRQIATLLHGYQEVVKRSEPYSDPWCYCQNEIPVLRGKWDQLFNEIRRN
jgi:hypothetical protein